MRKTTLVAGLAAAVLSGTTASASPSLFLEIDQTYVVNGREVTTQILLTDADDPGYINYSLHARPGAASPFTVISATGQGDPILTTADTYSVDLSGAVSAKAAGTITFKLSQTDLQPMNPVVGFSSLFDGNAKQGVTVRYDAWADTANTRFGTGMQLAGCSAPDSAAAGATFSFNCSGDTQGLFLGPYSMTEVVTFTMAAGTVASFDGLVLDLPQPAGTPPGVDLPEPMSAALLGAGVLGALLARRRRETA